MKIRIIEYSGEVGKIGEFLNYEFSIDLNSPGFKKQFFKRREKAHKRYLEMKRGIMSNVLQKIS